MLHFPFSIKKANKKIKKLKTSFTQNFVPKKKKVLMKKNCTPDHIFY